MDHHQWQAYHQMQFGNHHQQQHLSTPSKYTTGQSQYIRPYSYDPPSVASSTNSSSAIPVPSTTVGMPHNRDYIPDVMDTAMEDVDPYNRGKYSSQSSHQSRPSSQYIPTEESSAARRYSPMNNVMSSPSAAYIPTSPVKTHNSYAFPAGRQNSSQWSPNRASVSYSSPPQPYQSPSCEYTFFLSESA